MLSRNTSLRPERACILLDQTIDEFLVTPISFYVILRPNLVLLEPKDERKVERLHALIKYFSNSLIIYALMTQSDCCNSVRGMDLDTQ